MINIKIVDKQVKFDTRIKNIKVQKDIYKRAEAHDNNIVQQTIEHGISTHNITKNTTH